MHLLYGVCILVILGVKVYTDGRMIDECLELSRT